LSSDSLSGEASANKHRIHSGVVDEELVLDAVARETGARPARIEPRETQAPRLVYECAFDDREPVIFKAEVDAGDDAALALEAWAMERVRSLGVPAPRVIALDTSGARFPGAYAIIEKLAGVPLPPVWRDRAEDEADLAPDELRAVLKTAGEYLRRVHGVEVRGYGRLDDDRYLRTGEVRGRHAAWSDVTLAPALEALAYMESRSYLDAAACSDLRTVLREYDAVLGTCADPRLLHGDLGAKHIFVHPATAALTGIIDWGDRESGDPAMDLANFELWEDAARLEWLLEGYGDERPDLRTRILVYAIADGLRLAHKRYAQGRVHDAAPVVAWLMPRIERALRSL
jgi:aminoglycoside phosphotransferase (APT) family kinase protein